MSTCFEKTRAAVLALGLACAAQACAGVAVHPKAAADLSPASLYPMRASAAWSYDVDSGDGQSVLAIARVTRTEGNLVEVATGDAGAIGYVLRDDGITRAPGAGYLLKAPITLGAAWSSGPETTARVTALGVAVSTPAGNFADCVTVDEDNTGTTQHVTTTYCPGVGPARVISEMEIRGKLLRVDAKLRGYSVE
jgi:hypothetical protein